LAYVFLILRISTFRKDCAWLDRASGTRPYFRWPTGSLTEIFCRDSYTEKGRRLFPWLVAALGAVALGAIGVLFGAMSRT